MTSLTNAHQGQNDPALELCDAFDRLFHASADREPPSVIEFLQQHLTLPREQLPRAVYWDVLTASVVLRLSDGRRGLSAVDRVDLQFALELSCDEGADAVACGILTVFENLCREDSRVVSHPSSIATFLNYLPTEFGTGHRTRLAQSLIDYHQSRFHIDGQAYRDALPDLPSTLERQFSMPATALHDPASATAGHGHRIGQQLGDYKIIAALGAGSLGEVWEAEHIGSGERVAIKVPASPGTLVGILDEWLACAERCQRINHPGVVRIREVVRNVPCGGMVVMDLEQGRETLDVFLLRSRHSAAGWPTSTELVAAVRDLSDTVLSAFHEHGLLHLDIKPANLFVRHDLGQLAFKCLDIDFTRSQREIQAGRRHVYSPGFSPREVRRFGLADWNHEHWCWQINERSVVHELGSLLYCLFTGRQSPVANAPAGLPVHQANQYRQLAPVGSLGDDALDWFQSEVSRRYGGVSLTDIYRRATADQFDHRFDGVRDFAEALRQWIVARQQTQSLPSLAGYQAPPSFPELLHRSANLPLHAALLGGLKYPFGQALLAALEQWDERIDETRFVRLVCDHLIANCSGDILAVDFVPVLNHKSIGRSADKLRDLWTLVERDFPILAGRVRYRIVTSQSSLSESEVAAFQAGIQGLPPGRLEICPGANSAHDLLAFLGNHFPGRSAHELSGSAINELLRAGHEVEKAARRIWDDLRQSSSGGGAWANICVWTSKDQPPERTVAGQLITGEPPDNIHLSNGYFAKRACYERLYRRAEAWIVEVTAGSEGKTDWPIFWIQGPSGAGKSVALLFLMAHLHRSGFGPIQRLLDGSQSLAAAVARSADLATPESVPIIALDDPFLSPDISSTVEQWHTAQRMLMERRQKRMSGGIRPPLLLVCGTREQRSQLDSVTLGSMKITEFELGHPNRDELSELLDWLTIRLPPRDEEESRRRCALLNSDNIMLVQAMFEWSTGSSLREFAERFRQRVSAAGEVVQKWISSILVLNTFDIGFPSDLFEKMRGEDPIHLEYVRGNEGALLWEPSHHDLLDTLVTDQHFGFRRADTKLGGVCFRHPHFAEPIYGEWCRRIQPSRRQQREIADHLLNGILASLDFGGERPGKRAAPLWGLARATDGKMPHQIWLDPQIIGRVVERTLAVRQMTDLASIPLWLCPPLIKLLLSFGQVDRAWELIDASLRRLGGGNRSELGLRLLCHILMGIVPATDEAKAARITTAVLQCLNLGLPESDWAHVALQLLKLRSTPDDAIVDLCLQWVAKNAHSHHAPRLLAAILELGSVTEPILDLMRRMLPDADDNVWWCRSLEQVLKCGLIDRLQPEFDHWLARYHTAPDMYYILSLRLRTNFEATRNMGFAWLANCSGHSCANYVIEPMLEVMPGNAQLLEYGRNWFELGCGNASYVVEHLLQNGDRGERDLRICLDWIRDNTHVTNWSYVFETLVRCFGMSGEVVQVAQLALNRLNPNSNLWVHVWRRLCDSPQAREDAIRIAREWLNEHADHSGWPLVWKGLYKALDERGVLAALGHEWLEKWIGEHPLWPVVWDTLGERTDNRDKLRSLGKQFLAQHLPGDKAWDAVWTVTWPRGELVELAIEAREWLSGLDSNHRSGKAACPGLAQLWLLLCEIYPSDSAIKKLGERWLAMSYSNERVLDDPLFIQFWFAAWDREADEVHAYVKFGTKWLHRNLDHFLWPQVWQRLWEYDEADEAVTQFGLAWLESRHRHPDWPLVYLALRRRVDVRDRLHALGPPWLKMHVEAAGWHEVWIRQWFHSPGDPLLTAVGLERIERSLGDLEARHQIWHWIRTHFDREEKLQPIVERLLNAVTITGPDWSNPALDLPAAVFGEALRKKAISELRSIAPEEPVWPLHWKAAVRLTRGTDGVYRVGWEWLKQNLGIHAQWLIVWRGLSRTHENRKLLLHAGLSWLRQAEDESTVWYDVWSELIALHPTHPELSARAISWLSKNPDHRRWPRVWRHAWHTGSDMKLMFRLALDWLRDARHANNKLWQSAVWTPLVSSYPAEEELIRIGVEWLKNVDRTHPSWHYVWRTLYRSAPVGNQLHKVGQQWLVDAADDHHSWALLWLDLWNSEEDRVELTELGIGWLQRTGLETGHWSQVWQRLHTWHNSLDPLARRDTSNRIRQAAFHELSFGSFERPQWFAVFEQLIEADSTSVEALELGRQWLRETTPDNGSWDRMVTCMKRLDPGLSLENVAAEALHRLAYDHANWAIAWCNAERICHREFVHELGYKWLRTNLGARPNWQLVWDALAEIDGFRDRLIQDGQEWLGTAPLDHPHWHFVWMAVYALAPSVDEILECGLRWIEAESNIDHKYWQQVFGLLLDSRKCDSLLAVGLHWLNHTSPSHRSWQYAWKRLWSEWPQQRSELTLCGKSWLSRAPASHHSWQYVWDELWKSHLGDAELLSLAKSWLQATAGSDHSYASASADHSPVHHSWPRCFEALWNWSVHDAESSLLEELMNLAVDWLEQADFQEPADRDAAEAYRKTMVQWSYLWERLWEFAPHDERVRTLGIYWLNKVSPSVGSWSKIWCVLWQTVELRELLRPLGQRWLRNTARTWYETE